MIILCYNCRSDGICDLMSLSCITLPKNCFVNKIYRKTNKQISKQYLRPIGTNVSRLITYPDTKKPTSRITASYNSLRHDQVQ